MMDLQPRDPGEIIRALEIVMSSLKLDTKTADVLRYHLGSQREIANRRVEAAIAGLYGEERRLGLE